MKSLEFHTDYHEMRIAALKMARKSVEEFGNVESAVDFHATQCRVHLEILSALHSVITSPNPKQISPEVSQ